MMSRGILSASSTSSHSILSRESSDNGAFNVWDLIKRRTPENGFCLTSKYRMNAHVCRISRTTVTRHRRTSDRDKTSDGFESQSGTESDSSQEWDNFDEEEDDLQELYDLVTSQQSVRAAASSIITLSKQFTQSRPSSGVDSLMLEEISRNGTRSQKIYLKKCADFQISLSKIFLKALNTLVIDIGHQNIGPKGAEACAIALSQNTCIRILYMNDNDIQGRGAKYIAFMLKEHKNITDLNLSDNNIGSRGAKYLTHVISETDRIRKLDLSNNGFKEDDAVLFKQMLEETRNLAFLNLSHNMFREKGGERLGEALSYNDGLIELDLSWNHIRRAGAVGIAGGLLDNTSLKKLNLGWNGFYLEGCLEFARALPYNSTLEVLDLTNNRINRECLEHLTQGLAKNNTIHTLILKCNPLTSEGAHDILQFITDSSTTGIRLLDLGIQQVQSGFLHLINEIHLKKRKFEAIYGHVIGATPSRSLELEKSILKENPALILVEFGKMMGFRLMDLFASMDKNGSRTLNKDDIIKGLRMSHIPFSDQCISKMIRKLDVNGDGEIDFSELLVAQQEYRKESQKMTAAINSNGAVRVEDTSLWKIKTVLQKLVAEKMTDYSAFRRLSEQLAKQIQRASDEMEAKREAITRARARKPRKVRSRPISPVVHDTNNGIPQSGILDNGLQYVNDEQNNGASCDNGMPIKIQSSSSSSEELTLVDLEQTNVSPENDTAPPTSGRVRGKRMSIHLPISETDFNKQSSGIGHKSKCTQSRSMDPKNVKSSQHSIEMIREGTQEDMSTNSGNTDESV